ncbi:hypothetical protein ON010_g12620 [Phytophthora cinnamomi]|nr:hypothetical protein ON010_g12620 [Phytophthora cinnamomi]
MVGDEDVASHFADHARGTEVQPGPQGGYVRLNDDTPEAVLLLTNVLEEHPGRVSNSCLRGRIWERDTDTAERGSDRSTLDALHEAQLLDARLALAVEGGRHGALREKLPWSTLLGEVIGAEGAAAAAVPCREMSDRPDSAIAARTMWAVRAGPRATAGRSKADTLQECTWTPGGSPRVRDWPGVAKCAARSSRTTAVGCAPWWLGNDHDANAVAVVGYPPSNCPSAWARFASLPRRRTSSRSNCATRPLATELSMLPGMRRAQRGDHRDIGRSKRKVAGTWHLDSERTRYGHKAPHSGLGHVPLRQAKSD